MRRLFGLLVLAVTALAACVRVDRNPVSTTRCRPARGGGEALVVHLREMMTTTDPDEVFARDNYFHVPVVPPRRIKVVSDARTCERASAAYARDGGSAADPSVHVVRIGSKGFAVLDPEHLAGDKQTVKIFDARWNRIGGWTGP